MADLPYCLREEFSSLKRWQSMLPVALQCMSMRRHLPQAAAGASTVPRSSRRCRTWESPQEAASCSAA